MITIDLYIPVFKGVCIVKNGSANDLWHLFLLMIKFDEMISYFLITYEL